LENSVPDDGERDRQRERERERRHLGTNDVNGKPKLN
jgi:hypothetical protein